jgi:hypothetical protein
VFERLDRLTKASEIFRSLRRDYIALIDAAPSVEAVEASISKALADRLELDI